MNDVPEYLATTKCIEELGKEFHLKVVRKTNFLVVVK